MGMAQDWMSVCIGVCGAKGAGWLAVTGLVAWTDLTFNTVLMWPESALAFVKLSADFLVTLTL